MDNSPRLPLVSLFIAVILVIVTIITHVSGEGSPIFVLSEIEIGLVAAAFTLAIFGFQGLISVLLEGRRLQPGMVRPRLTEMLSRGIVLLSILLLAIAVTLAYGLVNDWTPITIGVAAGAGCVVLALLLVFYKEAFVGDEACFDEREDGVPW